jgi:hypothetical protein
MARATYVLRNGELVEKHLAAPLHASPSDLGAPQVIRDGMEPTFNHATGRLYDSKRAFERDTRRAGCVIVGDERRPEHQPARRPAGLDRPGADIKRAIEQLKGRP